MRRIMDLKPEWQYQVNAPIGSVFYRILALGGPQSFPEFILNPKDPSTCDLCGIKCNYFS
jgi:hypothetical protein